MGRPSGWMKKINGRGSLRSPGAPSHRNEIQRLFWKQIATGITSEKAAQAVGVSQAVGTDLSRWSVREIQAVATALNSRPRKTLGWRTPAERLDEYLKMLQ
jgi:hypothetical protein